mmetsp:Transcript_13499/g.34650  ORF Transcript_13499/g.34650 Transcript_13499/m.34650 type:complete len:230 (+) Transcript_13499:546-1235(+)
MTHGIGQQVGTIVPAHLDGACAPGSGAIEVFHHERIEPVATRGEVVSNRHHKHGKREFGRWCKRKLTPCANDEWPNVKRTFQVRWYPPPVFLHRCYDGLIEEVDRNLGHEHPLAASVHAGCVGVVGMENIDVTRGSLERLESFKCLLSIVQSRAHRAQRERRPLHRRASVPTLGLCPAVHPKSVGRLILKLEIVPVQVDLVGVHGFFCSCEREDPPEKVALPQWAAHFL